MHAVTRFVLVIYFDTVTLRTLLKQVRFGLRPRTGMVLTGSGVVVKNLTHWLPTLYPNFGESQIELSLLEPMSEDVPNVPSKLGQRSEDVPKWPFHMGRWTEADKTLKTAF